MPELFHFLLCYNFMMIITYRNFSTSSFVITLWWSLHTATFSVPPLLQLQYDHYIPQLFPFLLCYNFMMIITHRNFSKSFFFYKFMMIIIYCNFSASSFVITSCWSLYTEIFPLPPMLSLQDDHYIPQLFLFLLCYNFMMVITYRNFSLFSVGITSWWSLHTGTLPLPPLW